MFKNLILPASIQETIDRGKQIAVKKERKNMENLLAKSEMENQIIDKDKLQFVHRCMVQHLHMLCKNDRYNQAGYFIVDELNRQVLTNLKYYLARVPGILDLNKGVLFLGSTGTGKSLLLEMMACVMKYSFSWEVVMNIFTVTGITGSYYDSDNPVKWKCHNGFLGINDLGYEKPYKSGQNPVRDILFDRYERRLYTFATTNFDTQQIVDFYDDEDHRLLDRLESMFNIVVLTGPSRR